MSDIKGQMELFEQARAPIWHLSLNHHWVECPKCKSYNTATRDIMVGYGKERHLEEVPNERCPECGQLFDWSEAAVEAATKYSKDYLKALEEDKKNERQSI